MNAASPVVFLLACAKSKCATPKPEAVLSCLPRADAEPLAAQWVRQTAALSPTYSAAALYKGASWAAYRKVMAQMENVSAYALSAGFGVVPLSEELPAYSASFSSGEDRVARCVSTSPGIKTVAEKHRRWWSVLHKQRGVASCADLPDNHPDARFVVVGGKDYLDAAHDDLTLLARRCGSQRLFLISAGYTILPDNLLASCLLPTSAALEHLSPGPRLSLNARILLWLATSVVGKTGWEHEAITKVIDAALQKTSPSPPRAARAPLTDAQVVSYLHQWLGGETPQKSAGPMLRRLRSEGFACEEARFRRLYEQEKPAFAEGTLFK